MEREEIIGSGPSIRSLHLQEEGEAGTLAMWDRAGWVGGMKAVIFQDSKTSRLKDSLTPSKAQRERERLVGTTTP